MSHWWVPGAVAVGLTAGGTSGCATGDKLTNIEALTAASTTIPCGAAPMPTTLRRPGNDTFKGDLGADTIDGAAGTTTVTMPDRSRR